MTLPRYKFYLDDLLLEKEPKGWDDIRGFIKFDRTLNGLLNFIDVTFIFSGDGYEYLTDKLYGESFCSNVTLRISESCDGNNWTTAHTAIIKVSKLDINERTCEAKVKPDDNSYYAKIDKSRKQKAFFWAGRSKNDVAITAATIDKIKFFEPATGTYYPILAGVGEEYSCSGYRIYEAFKYLIAFMSDGQIEFDSTLFGIGGDYEGMMLTSGVVLFTVQTGLSEGAFKDEFPDISFEDTFKEVNKKINIGFYMDYSGAKPKMWIEKLADIPNGVDILTIDNIYQINTRIAKDRMYSAINIGSSTVYDIVSLQFPAAIDLLGFKEERYNTTGDCAEDNELNLVSEWIIDTNAIEDAVVTPSDAEADNIFLIMADNVAGIYEARQTNWLTPPGPPYFYNEAFTNENVLNNYFGAIPLPIAKFVGPALDGKFLATNTTGQAAFGVSSLQLLFQNDFNVPNFDTGSNYDPATSRYLCPASGVYSFTLTLPAGYAFVHGDVYLEIWDSTFSFVKSQVPFNIPYSPSIFTGSSSAAISSVTVNLTINDLVLVRWIYTVADGIVIPIGSTFSCTKNVTGGGVYKTYDPNDYLGLVHEFKYNLTRSQFEILRTNNRGRVLFAQAKKSFRRAEILSISFNADGESDLTLVTTLKQNVSVNT